MTSNQKPATGENSDVTLPALTKVITQNQLNDYANASGDHNPLHLVPKFAASTQFGGIIAHGMLTLAFISEMMVNAYGGHWLKSGSLKVRFKGAAYLGDKVETWGKVSKQEALGTHDVITCVIGLRRCADGQEIISGTATVKVGH